MADKQPITSPQQLAASRAYYEANRETVLAWNKEYRARNRDEIAAQRKAYREANADAIRARKKAAYERNREAAIAKQKAYYEANRETVAVKAKEARRVDRETDLDACRMRDRLRSRVDRERYPERNRAAALKSSLRRRYRLSHAEFLAMQESQGDRCPICKTAFNPSIRSFRPCVDHDHATGQVRGILCRLCNTGMGQFQDDPGLLRIAARYLEADKKGVIA